ncbi:hypothetical protein [Lentzea albidocapillata]|uniref:hypothetical protein n=1 Tax=Lentzea albidocapillata TaxID=40571 RepID=UPI0015A08D33|nr:hypothetical protein [Lentzea albidocapillata]
MAFGFEIVAEVRHLFALIGDLDFQLPNLLPGQHRVLDLGELEIRLDLCLSPTEIRFARREFLRQRDQTFAFGVRLLVCGGQNLSGTLPCFLGNVQRLGQQFIAVLYGRASQLFQVIGESCPCGRPLDLQIGFGTGCRHLPLGDPFSALDQGLPVRGQRVTVCLKCLLRCFGPLLGPDPGGFASLHLDPDVLHPCRGELLLFGDLEVCYFGRDVVGHRIRVIESGFDFIEPRGILVRATILGTLRGHSALSDFD